MLFFEVAMCVSGRGIMVSYRKPFFFRKLSLVAILFSSFLCMGAAFLPVHFYPTISLEKGDRQAILAARSFSLAGETIPLSRENSVLKHFQVMVLTEAAVSASA